MMKRCIKVIENSLEEKQRILQQIVERRNTIIENRKDRKHYRRKLGEVRFGEKGKQMELDKFYDIIGQKEKYKDE